MGAKRRSGKGRRGGFWRGLGFLLVLAAALVLAAHFYFDRETIILNDQTRPKPAVDYVRLTAGTTHFQQAGPAGGPVVILIHGATVPMWDWDPQFTWLAHKGLRVVRYDQFGRGFSDRPPGAYDRAFYRRQLLELINKLKLGKVHLVGHSFGGALAVDFAAHHPGLVKGLVLIAPMVNSVKGDTGIRLIRLPVIGGLLLRLIGVNAMAKRADKLLRHLPRGADYSRRFRDQFKVKGTEAAILAMFRSDAMRDYRPSYARVGRAGLPVLVIRGERDRDIDLKLLDQAVGLLKRKRPDRVTFKKLPRLGHSPNLEKPGKINALIVEFVKKTDGG